MRYVIVCPRPQFSACMSYDILLFCDNVIIYLRLKIGDSLHNVC